MGRLFLNQVWNSLGWKRVLHTTAVVSQHCYSSWVSQKQQWKLAFGGGYWTNIWAKCHIFKLFAKLEFYCKHFRVAFRANLNSNVSIFSFYYTSLCQELPYTDLKPSQINTPLLFLGDWKAPWGHSSPLWAVSGFTLTPQWKKGNSGKFTDLNVLLCSAQNHCPLLLCLIPLEDSAPLLAHPYHKPSLQKASAIQRGRQEVQNKSRVDSNASQTHYRVPF